MADREADSDGLNFNAFYMWSKSLNESETDGGTNGGLITTAGWRKRGRLRIYGIGLSV